MKFIYFFIAAFCISTNTIAVAQESADIGKRYASLLSLLGEEKYSLAMRGFEALVRNHPDFPKPYRTLVETCIYIRNIDSAQVFFNDLLLKNQQNPYAYYCLARLDFARGNLDGAIEKLQTAIRLNPDYADAYSHWGGLPEMYKAKGRLEKAERFFTDLAKKNPKNEMARFGLARTYIRQYEWPKALPLLLQIVKTRPHFTLAFHSLIYIYYSTGQFERAYQFSKKLLIIAQAQDDFEMIAYATSMIGNYYFSMGDYAQSLTHLDDALQIAKNTGDANRQAACLNTIASIYALSGNPDKALQFFQETLNIAIKTGKKTSQLRALMNIGNVFKDTGDSQKAGRFFYDALAKSREYGYKHQECLTISNLAEVHEQMGDFEKALQTQMQALKLARMLGEKSIEGYTLSGLGKLMLKKRNFAAAENYQRQALEIGNEIMDKQILWEAYAGLGETYDRQDKISEAVFAYKRAIALYDSVRATTALASLGSDFLKDKHDVYYSIIRLLAHAGNPNEAFRYAEKRKAKAILDIFSHQLVAGYSPASDSLRERMENIRARLDAAHAEYSTELLSVETNQAKILALDQRITNLELQEARVLQRLNNENREYYTHNYAKTIGRQELQDSVLKAGEALVQYIVGDDSILVFVVGKNSFACVSLPVSRNGLQSMLNGLGAVLAAENRGKNGVPILNAQLADFSIPPAHSLYNAIFKPVESFLSGDNELIIVRDDILNYLPFEMLIDDTSKARNRYDFAKACFLLEKYSISYTTAATMLLQDKKQPQPPGKGILAVGNPHFTQEKNPAPPMFSFANMASKTKLPEMDAVLLPHSEKEVKRIIKVLGKTKNRMLLREQATECNFKEAARDYTILHFATHFQVNDNQPLYAKLLFARDKNASEDGYLQTYEVMKMRLNAEMAVLSACNTGLGRLKRGEGLTGISRAFFQAGVPSVVVSLWNVDDASTATIMSDFYRYLRSGMDKRKALRCAKLNYMKKAGGEQSDPFYWAPFILLGDPKPLSLPVQPTSSSWKIFVLGLVIILLAIWIWRKPY